MRIVLALTAISLCAAQDSPELAIAKGIDNEIRKLKDLSPDARAGAIKDLASRIRQQPKQYVVPLAYNLEIEAAAASGRDTLQDVATTLADALRDAPARFKTESNYLELAQLARYSHIQVSIDDPKYSEALSKLEANDGRRGDSDFTLTDVRGKSWNLKSMRGKVVLLNFWATWCPPCRKEVPDLSELYMRFPDMVILSISDEEAATVKLFLAEQKISYPVLLDPGHKVKDLFLVTSLPSSFVFDREGRLVATALDRADREGFLEMLGNAGLR
jgi:peroxiredoxin